MNEIRIKRLYSYTRGNIFFIYHSSCQNEIEQTIEVIKYFYGYDSSIISYDNFMKEEYRISLLNKEIDYEETFFFIYDEYDKEFLDIYDLVDKKKGQIYELDYYFDDDFFREIEKIITKPIFYLSYNLKDYVLAIKVKEFLIKNNYEVYDELDHLDDDIKKKLYYNSYSKSHGYYIPLITRNSLKDLTFYKNYCYKKERNKYILPIVYHHINIQDYPKYNEGIFNYLPIQSGSEDELQYIIDFINMEDDD